MNGMYIFFHKLISIYIILKAKKMLKDVRQAILVGRTFLKSLDTPEVKLQSLKKLFVCKAIVNPFMVNIIFRDCHEPESYPWKVYSN